ncbi:M28 family metallopeptidase [Oceanobacillus sp. AG]|uniref:M28 family metallopeptidase n=1 Tax=Oceanobacillus sp. AG TaxID=2681969 RepID=UPI0012EBC9C7|nr:M28 family metallopeptidase [Oceanobacillus sp. AG]
MDTARTDQLRSEVDKDTLMTFTENIAKEIRLSGSEEEYRAFEYAEKQLKSFGFDTKLYTRKAYISLPIESSLRVNGQSFDSITHSMAVSTSETITGEVVYVGEGTFEDFSKQDTANKIVLIDGLAIPGAVNIAERFHVKAAIFINAEYTHEMIVSTNWGNPDLSNADEYPSIPVVSVNYQDGQTIIKEISDKYTTCELETKVETKWTDIPTLIADYKGTEDPDSYVLFSGHIDSWHYGVMDNGTANATMLEVARVIGENKEPLYRSLRLAFWSGHSHGRYAGSTIYADENWEDLYENCVMHVNIDSVGGKNAVVLSEGNAMAETKDIAGDAIKSVTGETYKSSRYGRSGDQSFWGMGVPSLLMGLSEQVKSDTPAMKAFSKLFGDGDGGGFGWWWHTTEDTLDKIDPENLERDCQIYLTIILNSCNSRILPLNQQKAIEDIEQTVKKYLGCYPSHPGLQKAIERVSEAKKVIIGLKKYENGDYELEQEKQINRMLMRISKTLVRLNYVNEDQFKHDPALSQNPVPLLADAQKLQDSHTDEELQVIKTTLLRKSNKFNFLLKELIEDIKMYEKQIGFEVE